MGERMADLTWTCHVCGKERPDDKISVYTTSVDRGGIEIKQNVRYCNDNPDCRRDAPGVRFI